MVLGLFTHRGPVGQYAAGQTLGYMLLWLATPLGAALFPRFSAMHAHQEAERARKAVMEAAARLWTVLLVGASVVAAVSPWAARWVYGDAFVQAGFWMRWFAYAAVWAGMGALVGALASAWGFQGWQARLLWATLPIAVLLYGMARKEGVMGVGLVAILVQWGLLAALWIRLARSGLVHAGWFVRASMLGWTLWALAAWAPMELRLLLPVLAAAGCGVLRVGMLKPWEGLR
ncbi:MAG: hypothetical protein D6771_03545 [Zetaproteobacteria bacterium]|nr:MAG: hypothetical protein D6771_03545 [Zetaproteobacteria bacterium]